MTRQSLLLLCVTAFALVANLSNPALSFAQEDGPPAFVPAVAPFDFDLRDHGIPIKSGGALFQIAAQDPVDNREKIYGTFGTSKGFLLVALDVTSGECQQYLAAGSADPWGMAVTPTRDLLFSTTAGEILRFEVRTKTFFRLAKADEGLYSMELARDGDYYLGSVPSCSLYRFDPRTGVLSKLARLDPEQTYLHAVVAGDDGFLYCPLGSLRAQVVAYNWKTGKFHPLLPPDEAVPGFVVQILRHQDGWVYLKSAPGHYYRARKGRAQRLDGAALENARKILQNFNVPRLADGTRLHYQDPDAIRIGEGPGARTLPFRYQADGAMIFHLDDGPDGIYGGSLLPLYLFRYRPETNSLENLGRGSKDNGEIYSFAHRDGKLYYATYPGRRLMCFDPSQPLDLRPDWTGNPRELTDLGPGLVRPRVLEADSYHRIWAGGLPAYGTPDGGLTCYDTRSGATERFLPVIPNQSIFSIAPGADGETLYCGTTTERGTGTQPVEKEAALFAWDVESRKVSWRIVPVPGETCIGNLIWQDGKLYGTTAPSGHFFVFDPATWTVLKNTASWFGPARDQAMTVGPDGNLYGITWMSLFRLRPDGRVEELLRCQGDGAKPYGGSLFHRGAVVRDGRFYFSWKEHLMSVRLPLDPGPRSTGTSPPADGRG